MGFVYIIILLVVIFLITYVLSGEKYLGCFTSIVIGGLICFLLNEFNAVPYFMLSAENKFRVKIEEKDFAEAHRLLQKLEENDTMFNDTFEEYSELLFKTEVLYLINMAEFHRAENLALEHPNGVEKLTSYLESQKSNIYKKLSDLSEESLRMLCSYMNPFDLVTNYIQVENENSRIINLLNSLPIKGTVQLGVIKDKKTRKKNEEYIREVNNYNNICDIVFNHAINHGNAKLARGVIQCYKKNVTTILVDTSLFGDDEYKYEWTDETRHTAIQIFNNAIKEGVFKNRK